MKIGSVISIWLCLLVTSANGQCRTATLTDDGASATGKLCKRSIKSSYAGNMVTEVRAGTWTYLNEDGALFKKGAYLEDADASIKTGEWQWFNENGKCFLKLKYEDDKPQQIIGLDSGIAVCGDDSAWVFMPDSAHYRIRFSMKGQHKQWDVEQLGEWLPYAPKSAVKKAYKPVVGIIGKNEETADAKGSNKPIKENIRWSDGEMLEMFPEVKKLAVTPMAGIGAEQNLINNPRFQSRGKPMKDGTYVLAPGMLDNWVAAELTPDIFVASGETILGVTAAPDNEMVRGTLKVPLVEDQFYCFSVQVKLRDQRIYALNRIGIVVEKSASYKRDKGNMVDSETGTFLLSPDNTPVCLRDSWMTIEGRFKAKGGEKYVYFGHFSDEGTIRHWALDSIYNFGAGTATIYYWLKNPVLIAAQKSDMCICNIQDCPDPDPEAEAEETETGEEEIAFDSFVLTAVQFETAKWNLLETSFDALDSLADYLLLNENYTVVITGHTDGEGKPKDNLLLSEKRAKAVFKYLQDKGIAAKRMQYFGKGDTEPVDDNGYEEGREHNRRVEFRIKKTE